jgi:hypothetical protein
MGGDVETANRLASATEAPARAKAIAIAPRLPDDVPRTNAIVPSKAPAAGTYVNLIQPGMP